MASSMVGISRRLLARSSHYAYPNLSSTSLRLSFSFSSSAESDSDSDLPVSALNSKSPFSALDSDDESSSSPSPYPNSSASTPVNTTSDRPVFNERPLENGLDVGIYKAILVGQVGQQPLQKTLKSGRKVTLISLGTGGIRNNRRPLDNEDPREYANRCAVQWHRVSVYPERLGDTVIKHVKPGTILYVEGNLESKIFNDPISGLVRRIREVAVRQNGRLVFLGSGGDSTKASQTDLRSVGYY